MPFMRHRGCPGLSNSRLPWREQILVCLSCRRFDEIMIPYRFSRISPKGWSPRWVEHVTPGRSMGGAYCRSGSCPSSLRRILA